MPDAYTMRKLRVAAWIVLTAALAAGVVSGCKQREPERKTETPVAADSVRQTAPPAPAAAAPLRDFAVELQARRQAYHREMESLQRSGNSEKARIHKLLLKYKGEILMAQRDVKAAAELTAAARDSLLKTLEQESITIAHELLTASP